MAKGTCSVEGCGRDAKTRGWCQKHYVRWLKWGDPLKSAFNPGPCSVEGCDRPSDGRGMCPRHYMSWRRANWVWPVCLFEGCDKPGDGGRGWCQKHWRRWRAHGDPGISLKPRDRLCSVEGCGRPHMALGWCSLHYQRDPEKVRRQQVLCIQRVYGMSPGEYDALLQKQGGVCAICCRPQRKFAVDHDHRTGVVRGLLCLGCNSGLGQFGDEDPEILRSAATYLERSRVEAL